MAAATLFVSDPGCAEAVRTLSVTIAGAVSAGSSTSDRSTDCDSGTYVVGSVGSRTSRYTASATSPTISIGGDPGSLVG